MLLSDTLVFIVIVAAIGVSVASGKIDRAGGVAGGLITYVLFLGSGWLGVILIGAFFVLGTLASHWKQSRKTALGVAEERGGQRGWRNVVANAGVAALVAFMSWPHLVPTDTAQLLVSACFAAALSDTWSSELGNVYGSRFYNVLTGKADQRGRDGVVSIEGSVAGVLGSAVIAGVYGLYSASLTGAITVWVAGMVGNLMDSVLGATLERKGTIGNHAVNFLNTLTAVLLAYLLVKNDSISS